MSNIDFSQMITAEDKAAETAQVRADQIRADCRAAILSVLSEKAQINAGNTASAYAAKIARGRSKKRAEKETGLTEQDLDVIEAGFQWIAAMQAECGRAIASAEEPSWPEVPDGLAELAARF